MTAGKAMGGDGAERFVLVDQDDRELGSVTREQVHGDPRLIHRVAHVLVWNSREELYLQFRSATKMVQPSRWDTSVGGHVDYGETYEQAAAREMREELGITGVPLRFLYRYLHRNDFESEYVATFECTFDGEIVPNPEEIDHGRFWSLEKIQQNDRGVFTPNFLDELDRYHSHVAGAG
jgi:isopentenyldiphosphate isomerase